MAAGRSVPRMGRVLVELERLERTQPPDVFLVDRVEAISTGVLLRLPAGERVVLSSASSLRSIAESMRSAFPGLPVPDDAAGFPWSSEPDVWMQWAQLHYALGAYEDSILDDAQVRVLAVERFGIRATVQILREETGAVENYSVHLDREIDLGLADTLAFAPAYGRVNGTLD